MSNEFRFRMVEQSIDRTYCMDKSQLPPKTMSNLKELWPSFFLFVFWNSHFMAFWDTKLNLMTLLVGPITNCDETAEQNKKPQNVWYIGPPLWYRSCQPVDFYSDKKIKLWKIWTKWSLYQKLIRTNLRGKKSVKHSCNDSIA